MSEIRRGHLYWVELDKVRPAVVVSVDVRNRFASSVIIIPCTSARAELPTHVRLGRGEGGLKAASTAQCENVLTVHKSALRGSPLGRPLSPARMAELVRGLLQAVTG